MFWTRYQRPIMLGLVAALLVLAIFGGYRLYTVRRDTAAAALLASAKNGADFQKIIADYPGSPAGPTATLLLANEQRKEQKFAEANTTLEAFIKQYPKHQLITTAKMALAANLESLGKPDEALEAYRRVAAEHPRDFNAPAAMISQVHLLKQKGQVDEARRVCETVLTQYRESYSSQEASQLLRTLKPSAPAAIAPQNLPAPQGSPAATSTPQSSPTGTSTPQG